LLPSVGPGADPGVQADVQAIRTAELLNKSDIAVHNRNQYAATGNHMPYGITQCYLPPGSSDFPALPQLKLVLDFATPEGCKAELIWLVVIS